MHFKNILGKLTFTKTLDLSGKLEKEFFEIVYRFRYLTGHSTADKSIKYQLYRYLIRILIAFFIFCELWYMFTECQTWNEVVDSINVSVINLMAIYRYKTVLNHKDVFHKLSKAMVSSQFDTASNGRKEIVQNWVQTNRDYTKFILVLGHFTLLVWYIYPLIDDESYNLCLKIRLPFFYKSAALYPIAYILVVAAFHATASFVMGIDLLMQTHFVHLICQFAILGDCFENILTDLNEEGFEEEPNKIFSFYNEDFVANFNKRFDMLVNQHNFLISQTEELKQILSTPLLGQFIISGALICFSAYQATVALRAGIAQFLMSLLYLGYNMLELLIYCRWSDEIELQSMNIRNSVYCCGWERCLGAVRGLRIRIIFVIVRSSKQLALTAGGMRDLSLEAFSQVVKTSYSALTLLLRMEET